MQLNVNDAQAIEVSELTFGGELQRNAGAPGSRSLYGWRSSGQQAAKDSFRSIWWW